MKNCKEQMTQLIQQINYKKKKKKREGERKNLWIKQ